MSCICSSVHTSTALSTAGLLTVTNPNNIGSFDKFCLVLTINPDSVITGPAVEYTITINGVNVPIVDRWGYPITTDRLSVRKGYIGRYIDSETPHLTLLNACGRPASTSTTATDSSGS